MIKWVEKKTLGAPMFYAELPEWKSLGSDVVAASLVTLLQDIVFPRNSLVEWNALAVELWLDTGSIYIFPAQQGNRYRIEKCGIHLVCEDLSEEWDGLDDADPEFDVKLKRLHGQVAQGVAGLFKKRPLSEARKRGASLVVFEAEEADPLLTSKL